MLPEVGVAVGSPRPARSEGHVRASVSERGFHVPKWVPRPGVSAVPLRSVPSGNNRNWFRPAVRVEIACTVVFGGVFLLGRSLGLLPAVSPTAKRPEASLRTPGRCFSGERKRGEKGVFECFVDAAVRTCPPRKVAALWGSPAAWAEPSLGGDSWELSAARGWPPAGWMGGTGLVTCPVSFTVSPVLAGAPRKAGLRQGTGVRARAGDRRWLCVRLRQPPQCTNGGACPGPPEIPASELRAGHVAVSPTFSLSRVGDSVPPREPGVPVSVAGTGFPRSDLTRGPHVLAVGPGSPAQAGSSVGGGRLESPSLGSATWPPRGTQGTCSARCMSPVALPGVLCAPSSSRSGRTAVPTPVPQSGRGGHPALRCCLPAASPTPSPRTGRGTPDPRSWDAGPDAGLGTSTAAVRVPDALSFPPVSAWAAGPERPGFVSPLTSWTLQKRGEKGKKEGNVLPN